MYHQDARFQRQQQKLARHSVSALKGRDHEVATAAMAEELEVALYPYMIETCADETWQLEHFPTRREQAALGDRMGPTDLENALARVLIGSAQTRETSMTTRSTLHKLSLACPKTVSQDGHAADLPTGMAFRISRASLAVR
jgi:hypothetical protein